MTKPQQNPGVISASAVRQLSEHERLLMDGFRQEEVIEAFAAPAHLLKPDPQTEAAALAEHEQALKDGIAQLTKASEQLLAIPNLDIEFGFNKADHEFIYIVRYRRTCLIAARIDLTVQQATVDLGLLCLRVHSLMVALDHTNPAHKAAQPKPTRERTMQNQDNITNFIGELDAGAFQRRVAACLAEVAKGISLTDKPGEITLSFKIKPAKNSNQTGAGVRVGVTSKISYTRPLTRASSVKTTPLKPQCGSTKTTA